MHEAIAKRFMPHRSNRRYRSRAMGWASHGERSDARWRRESPRSCGNPSRRSCQPVKVSQRDRDAPAHEFLSDRNAPLWRDARVALAPFKTPRFARAQICGDIID